MIINPKLNQILLVDDSFDDNFFHKRVIEKMDLAESVETALDGVEALEYLQGVGNFEGQTPQHPKPELILLDINMPRMNGWEFLEKYHALPAPLQSSMVIVMLTTSLNPEDQKQAERLNLVRAFFSKPLTQEMMREVIKKHFPERIVSD